MFGIGANELIIILIFGFIIFGPDKLPAMAKTIGQAIAKFRNAQAEMSRVIKTEVYDPDAEDPFKNPLDALSKLESQATKEDRGESFTQRKARYDKQRAARKAAEERKAEQEAKKAAEKAAEEAALERGEGEEAAKEAAKRAGEEAASAVAAQAAKEADASAKKPTADELYGVKSSAKKSVQQDGGTAAARVAPAKSPKTKSANAASESAGGAPKSAGTAQGGGASADNGGGVSGDDTPASASKQGKGA